MNLEDKCTICPYNYRDCNECTIDKIREHTEIIKEQVVGYTIVRRELSKRDEYDVVPIVQSDYGVFLSKMVKKRQKYVNTIPAPCGIYRVSIKLPQRFDTSEQIEIGYQYEQCETDFEPKITSQIQLALLKRQRRDRKLAQFSFNQ